MDYHYERHQLPGWVEIKSINNTHGPLQFFVCDAADIPHLKCIAPPLIVDHTEIQIVVGVKSKYYQRFFYKEGTYQLAGEYKNLTLAVKSISKIYSKILMSSI